MKRKEKIPSFIPKGNYIYHEPEPDEARFSCETFGFLKKTKNS